MGNQLSMDDVYKTTHHSSNTTNINTGGGSNGDSDDKAKYRSFPGSAILEKTFCGSIDTTDPDEYRDKSTFQLLMRRADAMCVSSPMSSQGGDFYDDGTDDDSLRDTSHPPHLRTRTSAAVPTTSPDPHSMASPESLLLARALVSEVINNPKTMTPQAMAQREKQLLKAQQAAIQNNLLQNHHKSGSRPIGADGPPHVLRSMAFACTGDDAPNNFCTTTQDEDDLVGGLNGDMNDADMAAASPYTVTVGVSMSQRTSVGHPSTTTRQSVFELNELQDRSHSFVSGTAGGWRAGGGEAPPDAIHADGAVATAAVDHAHVAIAHIHCGNQAGVDAVISALASGEIFIPEMSVLPQALQVSQSSPPDLQVTFGCDRSNDVTVEEWPNWCLEFIHNQLYDYFQGSVWMKRDFSLTLAKGVRWKTVKHMNKYFAGKEKVLHKWKKAGPQTLVPTMAHISGGASHDECTTPHGIYLFRNGTPTNYFPPNFAPPYTTKMTRSLLHTVLSKSWDKKRMEWSSAPLPRLVAPATLMAAACGCSDPGGGFMAKEATTVIPPSERQRRSPTRVSSDMSSSDPVTHSVMEFGDVDNEEDGASSLKENRQDGQRSSSSPSHHHRRHHRTKKMEGLKVHSNGDGSSTSFVDDSENNRSVAHSGFQSVAGSGTTVQHANNHRSSSSRKSPIKGEKSSLFSDEDFLDELSATDENEGRSSHWRSSPRQALEEERTKQNELVAKVRHMDEHSPTKRNQQNGSIDRVKSRYTSRSGVTPPPLDVRSKLSLTQSVSLDYSTDGSASAYFQEASLLGQHVLSSGEDQTTSSASASPNAKTAQRTPVDAAVASGPVQAATPTTNTTASRSPIRRQQLDPPKYDEVEEEESMLSIQESTSSMQSVIPTDEELFSVGWAKALDANSGNYYYFTLDRTKTVWENPLAASQWGGELPPPVRHHGVVAGGLAASAMLQPKIISVDP